MRLQTYIIVISTRLVVSPGNVNFITTPAFRHSHDQLEKGGFSGSDNMVTGEQARQSMYSDSLLPIRRSVQVLQQIFSLVAFTCFVIAMLSVESIFLVLIMDGKQRTSFS